ncbi:uncharacterized protein BT62DRAFT_923629 [Guyanagaster necrorhizus]|uniref:Uncharacterized protein n=1 Tax=Guyanagaster necrorhizus TaxID=856835 RepID=A0A9P8AMS4_9AGAR|nr:uncharacterized protein BT62DRAFT_923629 [Guyanagaster necrorhizus MCA 3950]KAG7441064.1 hypothetical protein BT62DRAFT_923629 [Guyanagaster necrorhizus MCA 3950]
MSVARVQTAKEEGQESSEQMTPILTTTAVRKDISRLQQQPQTDWSSARDATRLTEQEAYQAHQAQYNQLTLSTQSSSQRMKYNVLTPLPSTSRSKHELSMRLLGRMPSLGGISEPKTEQTGGGAQRALRPPPLIVLLSISLPHSGSPVLLSYLSPTHGQYPLKVLSMWMTSTKGHHSISTMTTCYLMGLTISQTGTETYQVTEETLRAIKRILTPLEISSRSWTDASCLSFSNPNSIETPANITKQLQWKQQGTMLRGSSSEGETLLLTLDLVMLDPASSSSSQVDPDIYELCDSSLLEGDKSKMDDEKESEGKDPLSD